MNDQEAMKKVEAEWEKVHEKYLQLMWEYIDSFAEVHRRHKIMMDFYKKEVEPRRKVLLEKGYWV